MEPLQRIIDKIMEDANWKIKGYDEEADKKIEKIRKREEERWEEERKKMEYEGKREAEGIKSMLISRAYLEGKRELMDAKEEIIKTVVRRIKEEARNAGESYKKCIRDSLIDAKRFMGEDMQVICLKEDRDLVELLVREICPNAKLIEGHVPFGGIIVVTRDYLQKMDYSIDALVERKMSQIRKEISSRLFEG